MNKFIMVLSCFDYAIYQKILMISPRIDLQWGLLHFLWVFLLLGFFFFVVWVCFVSGFFFPSFFMEGQRSWVKKFRKAYKCCFPSRLVQGCFSFQENKRFISGRSRTGRCWLGKMTLWHLQAAFSNAEDKTCVSLKGKAYLKGEAPASTSLLSTTVFKIDMLFIVLFSTSCSLSRTFPVT